MMLLRAGIGLAICFASVCCGFSSMAQGPESTLVVVNEESPDSLAIASHYIKLRNIPAVNVVYLRGITTIKQFGPESSSSKAFQREILNPILKTMKDRGIEDQIDCITYSAGFPTRINIGPEGGRYLKITGKKYSLKLHAPWASITSLTYFYRNAFSASPTFLALDANNFGNSTPSKAAANPFVDGDARKFAAAIQSARAGDYPLATEQLLVLARKHPRQMAVVFALARVYALAGKKEKVLTTLRHAQVNGFAGRSVIEKDSAFREVIGDPVLKKILQQMENLPNGVLPTRSFSGQSYWAKNGWPNGNEKQGQRYTLSTVLAVTGENQSSVEDSIARLEASVKADGSSPAGLVYFADHKDPRSRTRKHQFKFAAAELKSLGREASIGSDVYPKNRGRVIGVTLGSPILDWEKSGSRFLPGAIGDNFTSYGGWWQKTGQTQLTEFLDAGAAGASGTVYEPYTITAKLPSARWHVHYARGCTLAESYYQSVSGPFQTLIVGDPMCCPFGDFPKFSVEGLKPDAIIKDDFELEIRAADDGPAIRSYGMFYDGVFLTTIKHPDRFKVAIDDMKDGRHEIRIVGVADTPTANRSTRILEFVVGRTEQKVDGFSDSKSTRLLDSIHLKSADKEEKEIELYQNSRILASTSSDQLIQPLDLLVLP